MPSRLRLADRAAMARKKARDESAKSVATAGFSTMLRRPVPGAVGAPNPPKQRVSTTANRPRPRFDPRFDRIPGTALAFRSIRRHHPS